MTMRLKIECSVFVIFVFGMLVWAFSCTPGTCMDQLSHWLMVWWAGIGVLVLYMLWAKKVTTIGLLS